MGSSISVARWEDLLDLDGLDAVSVAVPTFLHAPIAIAALERGIHVLCEKPIALNGPQADAMVQAARAADRVLEVAFNHRQRGDIQELKRRRRPSGGPFRCRPHGRHAQARPDRGRQGRR